MTIALIFIATAVGVFAVRAGQRAWNERRHTFRPMARKRTRTRRTEYLF
jgi:hypothetical protein